MRILGYLFFAVCLMVGFAFLAYAILVFAELLSSSQSIAPNRYSAGVLAALIAIAAMVFAGTVGNMVDD